MLKLDKFSRLDAYKLLITIAQTGYFELEAVVDKLKNRFHRLGYCCVAREIHKDKGIHCHIFLELQRTMKLHYGSFDFLFQKHANIQKIRASLEDKTRAWQYVRKAQQFLEYGQKSFVEIKEKILKKKIPQYVTKAIQEGITLAALLQHENEEIRSYAFNHSKHIRTMIFEYQDLQLQQLLERKQGIQPIQLDTSTCSASPQALQWIPIINQLQEAMVYKWNRPFKSLNLHIWSNRPNMGKSTLVRRLMELSPCYLFPPDGWFTRYHNYLHHFIIWDEMSLKGLDPSFLNLFLEGSRCQLPIKGDLTHKWDNPLVIMLSNKPLKKHLNCIKDKVDRAIYEKTLAARIKEIEITFPLFEFVKLIQGMDNSNHVDN